MVPETGATKKDKVLPAQGLLNLARALHPPLKQLDHLDPVWI
jgi:hypothetical protein